MGSINSSRRTQELHKSGEKNTNITTPRSTTNHSESFNLLSSMEKDSNRASLEPICGKDLAFGTRDYIVSSRRCDTDEDVQRISMGRPRSKLSNCALSFKESMDNFTFDKFEK